MSLETPNRVHASCVVLAQNALTPGEETLEFRSNTGFKGIVFVDPEEPELGIVMELVQEVTNDEGSVYVGGDPNSPMANNSGDDYTVGWITPINDGDGVDDLLLELPRNQVVVSGIFPKTEGYRFYVVVFAQLTEVEPIAGEPIEP